MSLSNNCLFRKNNDSISYVIPIIATLVIRKYGLRVNLCIELKPSGQKPEGLFLGDVLELVDKLVLETSASA